MIRKVEFRRVCASELHGCRCGAADKRIRTHGL